MNAENKTPIASISDAEHSVPTSEKNIPEFAFFNEEAIRIKQAFSNMDQNEHPLLYLQHQLRYMKRIMTKLELPWDQYIPLLFRCFSRYMFQEESKSARNRNYYLSSDLMECITFLSQSGRLINNMAAYFDNQIKEIDRIIAEKDVV